MIDWNPIAEKFREADAILIGASNGLSITEGLHLFADNAAFEKDCLGTKQKYGLGHFAGHDGWIPARRKMYWTRPIHHYWWEVPAYAGDERFESDCGERLLCRHIKRRRSQ